MYLLFRTAAVISARSRSLDAQFGLTGSTIRRTGIWANRAITGIVTTRGTTLAWRRVLPNSTANICIHNTHNSSTRGVITGIVTAHGTTLAWCRVLPNSTANICIHNTHNSSTTGVITGVVTEHGTTGAP